MPPATCRPETTLMSTDTRASGIDQRPYNLATAFVDRHLAEGRGDKIAIRCGDGALDIPSSGGADQPRWPWPSAPGSPRGRASAPCTTGWARVRGRVLRHDEDRGRRRADEHQPACGRLRLRARREPRPCGDRSWFGLAGSRAGAPAGACATRDWMRRRRGSCLGGVAARLPGSVGSGGDDTRRCGVLAVDVGEHGQAQGSRASARGLVRLL